MTPQSDGRFPSTNWTLVSRIHSTDETVAAKALDELCTQYHYPLYCYLRRRGCNHFDAQDVLHDFIAKLLRLRVLERLDESKGRLRGYLALSIERHLHRWQTSNANLSQVAPGIATTLDFAAIEYRYQREKFDDRDTPDRIFERKWATEMLLYVIGKLDDQYRQKDKAALFATLRPVLENGGSLRGENCSVLAARAGISEPSLRTALNRLLHEFGVLLHDEVRLTVERADEVHDEMSYLMSLFHH